MLVGVDVYLCPVLEDAVGNIPVEAAYLAAILVADNLVAVEAACVYGAVAG